MPYRFPNEIIERPNCTKCGTNKGALLFVFGEIVCGECYIKMQDKAKALLQENKK